VKEAEGIFFNIAAAVGGFGVGLAIFIVSLAFAVHVGSKILGPRKREPREDFH
jgi:hypothetical protein